MSEPSATPGTAPVTDSRPVPRGVLPRSTQTWLMAGIAVGILGIILIAGRPEAPARSAATVTTTPLAPNPDRVREYQAQLRQVEARAAQEAQVAALTSPVSPPTVYEDPQAVVSEDPLMAERRRREYQSLFASNVVLSRRSGEARPDLGQESSAASVGGAALPEGGSPSLDDVAEAVIRATARAGASATPFGNTPVPTTAPMAPALAQPVAPNVPGRPRSSQTEAISAAGPVHRVLEGTVIDTVLANRLDGSTAAPVNCLVTNPIYSHSRQHVVIPAGARVLGETRPVQSVGETRLAVAFHRLVMPDGRTYGLDGFLGLNQIGDAGLRDRVNHHYGATFGAAGAVGLISGLAQFLGTVGLGRGDGDRTLIIAGNAGDATAQVSLQVMNRFLNRMPTITIREGHRVKVYLTGDLELPAYDLAAGANPF